MSDVAIANMLALDCHDLEWSGTESDGEVKVLNQLVVYQIDG